MSSRWPAKALGEVCRVVNGGTPRTRDPEYWGGPHRWITPAEMGERDNPYVATTARTLTDKGLQNCSASLSPAGSVILSTRAPIGHLVINTEPMATNQGCRTLVPSSALDHKFLYHYLGSIREVLDGLGTGATFRELSAGTLKGVDVPLPPLADQQRIVRLLDESFDSVANARENTETNLRNARAVFESRLDSIFTQRGGEWAERRLAEHVQCIATGPFGSLLHKSDYEQGGRPLVNPVNIRGETIVADDRKAVGKATAERLAGYALREMDVVIARRGEIGRCAVVAQDQAGWLCGTGCFVVRPSDRTDSHFLAHLLRSRPYRERLEGMAARATMPNLSNKDLADLVVAVPPMSLQRRIVTELDCLSAERERLASVYQRKLAALDELKQSLLGQAFSGQL